uniref:Histone H4 transcription factor n=1 Tax=Phallusia mammillata TaxID=59560 RepID=A0A6F9DF57_9ASCI|nr:histone H4 transcription factor [Phallusia mammillata]
MGKSGRKSVKFDELQLQCEWGGCGIVYNDLGKFYSHLETHYNHDIGSNCVQFEAFELGCRWNECAYFTTDKEDLLRHLYFHGYHTKLKWWGMLCNQQEQLGQCRALHNRNVIPELPEGFHCDWENCDMVCDIPDQFYMHVYDHIMDDEILPNKQRGFACHWEGCTYSYELTNPLRKSGAKYKLREHLRTHTKERTYACPWCGNLYVNKTKYADHLSRQISIESHCFQCTHCSRTFASERLLKDHMRHHVNHYKCPKCAMTCPNPSALKHHIRYKHSDERPFACQFCPYRSKAAYDLQVHMVFHQQDLSYKCHVAGCDYAVRSLQNLRYHFRTKHLEGRGKCYACHLCDKKYGVGHQLTNHLRNAHSFHWPPGHTRFKYKECDDHLFRLQTFRFESVELTEQLLVDDQDTTRPETEGTQHPSRTRTLRKRKHFSNSSPVKRITRAASSKQKNKKILKPTERLEKKKRTVSVSFQESLVNFVTNSDSNPETALEEKEGDELDQAQTNSSQNSSPMKPKLQSPTASPIKSPNALSTNNDEQSTSELSNVDQINNSSTDVLNLDDGVLARDENGKPIQVKVDGNDFYLVKGKEKGTLVSYCLVSVGDFSDVD